MSFVIERPTLLLHTERVKENIRRMGLKAQRQGIRFRPHFKTHQSAEIGEWFRESGVEAITVSSVEMAGYFARHGWEDIIIAFPVNWRQINVINVLARTIHLGLLVESLESVSFLHEALTAAADVWIEIDDGSNRSGMPWQNLDLILTLAEAVHSSKLLNLRGILTHAGRIYHAGSPDAIQRTYAETVERMNHVRQFLSRHNISVEISVGDTPGCTLSQDLGLVDEIRPGNFVFYDAMQLAMEVCELKNIASVVACPVVARYPSRSEVVVYGGAVHLSKDTVEIGGQSWYGLVASLDETSEDGSDQGWLSLVQGGFVTRLSQEHGVVILSESAFNRVQLGSVLYIIPAHVCLTVSALGEYKTQTGKTILTLNKEV